MDEDNIISHRDEMLSRFRESVRKPMSERYFDEDELLEIFDYAGDIQDDYLRTEALLCAARFYPDSEAFMQRKAVYYSQYSDEIRDKFLDDNESASGMVYDILRARRRAQTDPEWAMSYLNTIVDYYKDFTDEEIIQLIEMPSVLGRIDWIKDNLPTLRRKVSFVNILLYEIAVAADANGDAAFSVQMLEELTELEPFNPYYWMMLAKEYAVVDEVNKAISAIDYALAINPDDAQAITIKARLLYTANQNDPAVMELIDKSLADNPDDFDTVKLCAAIATDKGDNQKAIKVLRDYLERHKSEAVTVIPDLVVLNPDDTDSLLDMFYEYSEDNSQIIWMTWSHQLMLNGMPELSQKVLSAYQRNSGVKILSLLPIETLFTDGKYDEALSALADYLEVNDSTDVEFPTMVYINLMSLIGLEQFAKARQFCDFLFKTTSITSCKTLSKRIEYLGIMCIVEDVYRNLKEGRDQEFWHKYDPLLLHP